MSNEFQLDGIVPWGRTADEYEAYFDLANLPVSARVLDCGGGPASFSAQWTAHGRFTVSCDPIYAQSPAEIAAGFEGVAGHVLDGMRKAYDRFNWSFYGSPERVVERRRAALAQFLADRSSPGVSAGYVAARLPDLPFAPDSFDVVLCSHLLFLYSDDIDFGGHVAALSEMLRVGREVRVFPLVDLNGDVSRHLDGAVEAFGGAAHCEIVPVPFEFQVGANSMLRLRRR